MLDICSEGLFDRFVRFAVDNLIEVHRIQFLVVQLLHLMMENHECIERMGRTLKILVLLIIGGVPQEKCHTEAYYQ